VLSRPPSGKSRNQQGVLLRWWLEPYEFELQARGHSAGPESQRGQQQGLARKSLPPPMPGVCRLKGGQLASALVRPRRLREPGATPTQGLRAVPGGAWKGLWVVLGKAPRPRWRETLETQLGVLDKTSLDGHISKRAGWKLSTVTRTLIKSTRPSSLDAESSQGQPPGSQTGPGPFGPPRVNFCCRRPGSIQAAKGYKIESNKVSK
jgi:hypothetical protein